MVECNLPKVEVAGSIPVSRFCSTCFTNPLIFHNRFNYNKKCRYCQAT